MQTTQSVSGNSWDKVHLMAEIHAFDKHIGFET